MKRWCLAFACLTLLACNSKKPFEKRIDTIFKGPVFRDLTISDSYDKVLSTENSEYLLFSDTNMLRYSYHVSDSEEYHWAYVFEEDRLSGIQFDAYLGAKENGTIYFRCLEKKYDKILAREVAFGNEVTWKADEIYARLVNESEEAMMGKIRLSIFGKPDTSAPKEIPLFKQ